MFAFKIRDFYCFTLRTQLFQIHAAVVTVFAALKSMTGVQCFTVTRCCWYCTLNNHLDYTTFGHTSGQHVQGVKLFITAGRSFVQASISREEGL